MILVTGATGFLGQRLCRRLKEASIAFKRTSLSLGTDLRDFNQALELFETVRPTIILNCASYAGGIQFGLKQPADIFRNNMPMIANLFEAAHQSGVRRVVNPLANCVYPAQLTVFEESRFWEGPLHESVMVYGLLRKLSWMGSWAYAKQWGLETINLVFSNMYGPGDHFDEVRSHAVGGLVSRFLEAQAIGAKEVIVWGSGAPVREWLYVDDAAEAMIRAMTCAPCDQPVNVGVGRGVSIANVAERIKALVHYDGRILYDTSKTDGAPHKMVDGTRGAALLGWSPQTDLDEGLARTVEWYKRAQSFSNSATRTEQAKSI